MPGQKCACCGKWKKTNSAFRICSKTTISILQRTKNCELQYGAKVCAHCRLFASRIKKKETPVVLQNIENVTPTSSHGKPLAISRQKNVHLQIPRCHNSNTRCIVCNKKNNIVTVPRDARNQAFIERGIYITPERRCCRSHLNDKKVFLESAVKNLRVVTEDTFVSEGEITKLLGDLRKIAKVKGLDFDTPSRLSSSDYYTLMGIQVDDFDYIWNLVKERLRSSKIRSSRTCVAILLVKLRTGLSNNVLSTLFNVNKRLVAKSIHSARQALMAEFVPLHLGMDHISRQKFIDEHSRPLAKQLFGCDDDCAIVVADGTYIYIQKSGNYSFQRRCFSLHKGRPLVKPMMLVSTKGYILNMFGPYFADSSNSDANILTHIMKTDADKIKAWLKPNDVMVVDRGFRDCLELLEDMRLVPKMPLFLYSQSQFPTEEANEVRLVTKIRWVVEAVNGQLKNWNVLNNVLPNSQIPYVGDYVRIICAMLNAFHPSRITSTEDDEIIADRMLSLVRQPNTLKLLIENTGLARKKVIWKQLSADALPDFPRLSLDELRRLTLGVYQLKQSESYTQEHIQDDGLYSMYIHQDHHSIIRVQLRSRHIRSKVYNVWIRASKGMFAQMQWYCQCKVGARVVGCCAHVASVLWYLSYWRHQSVKHAKPSSSYSSSMEDAAGGWSSDDNCGDNDPRDEEEEF